MLHLVTGANGAGKTLLTLKHVKELADKEGRPVCYNGRFDLVEDGPLRNWRKIDIKDWQAEPDGTIFLVDECHNDFPVRGTGAPVPEYVRMLAEHRKRGFDFFLITQHPQNIDVFVRRLVGNPGWHRHLKRQAGANLVSVLQWDAVNPQCERPGSGESGQVTLTPYPKEVYAWYRSAELHTVKRRIPRPLIVFVVGLVLIPLLGWFAMRTLFHGVSRDEVAKITGAAPSGASGGSAAPGAPGGSAPPAAAPRSLTAAEYVQARMPRLAGLAYTAPAYDEVTRPSIAPYPAACILHHKDGRCDCYTQQATRLEVPQPICVQIARYGIFVDWQQARAEGPGLNPSLPGDKHGGPEVANSDAPKGRGQGYGAAGPMSPPSFSLGPPKQWRGGVSAVPSGDAGRLPAGAVPGGPSAEDRGDTQGPRPS